MRRVGAVAARGKGHAMNMRTRKLIGAVLLLILLTVYAFVALAVAVVLQVSESKWVEPAFYLIAGLAWVIPAGILVKWMVRPDEPSAAQRAAGKT